MSLAYTTRLIGILFAAFFLVYLFATVAVAFASPLALRRVQALAPRRAAALLLLLRLLPGVLSVVITLGLCLPAFLLFEPEEIQEPVGPAFLLSALLGAAVLAFAALRSLRAVWLAYLFANHCQQAGHELQVAGHHPSPLVIPGVSPVLALIGITRPRVVISQGILEALSAEQLAVVLRHELAHRSAGDNRKRLALSLAPALIPWLRRLESDWTVFSEYAADDQAVAGSPTRSLALASALVHVARLGLTPTPSPVAMSFLAHDSHLAARVDRLLSVPSALPSASHNRWPLLLLAAIPLAACQPDIFRAIQNVLERLVN